MDRIKEFLKNLSIRKTFILYTIIFLLIAAALSSISINIAYEWKNGIQMNYIEDKEYIYAGSGITIIPSRSSDINYTAYDKIVINICDFVQTWSLFICFSTCILSASFLFYRTKLEKPLMVLMNSAKNISENNLDFTIDYQSRDEMGKLCSSFEMMRAELYQNNSKMWRMMEERRQLNAAFAHDLRTPLTVLKGYSDFLKRYVPEGKVSNEKLVSTVSVMSEHIARLESYVTTMNNVQKLEDITVSKEKIDSDKLFKRLSDSMEILSSQNDIKIDVINEVHDITLMVDERIVMQVLDNIVSNALRYAKNNIKIHSAVGHSFLRISVWDDGRGFTSEDMQKAVQPFYRGKGETNDVHFGLGLNICKTLCEKHGGSIELSNNETGGANVAVTFSMAVDKK